jgi:hypothetical protein
MLRPSPPPHSDIHLRAGADEVLSAPEIDHKPIRRRVALPQRRKEHAGGCRALAGESLAKDCLKKIAHPKFILRALNARRKITRRGVWGGCAAVGAVWRGESLAGEACDF